MCVLCVYMWCDVWCVSRYCIVWCVCLSLCLCVRTSVCVRACVCTCDVCGVCMCDVCGVCMCTCVYACVGPPRDWTKVQDDDKEVEPRIPTLEQWVRRRTFAFRSTKGRLGGRQEYDDPLAPGRGAGPATSAGGGPKDLVWVRGT